VTGSCMECDRRLGDPNGDGMILNISPRNGSVRHLSKGPESMLAWEASNRDSIRPTAEGEVPGRRHSILKSMNLFRMGPVPREGQEFQVRVVLALIAYLINCCLRFASPPSSTATLVHPLIWMWLNRSRTLLLSGTRTGTRTPFETV
jgi:hypothetical protein